uniref:NADH-cytochrome b5 reductase n=1 Tax=Lygus hesperus TaxID=30085 RepID=A0A0A9YKZ4_LYGHE
MYGKNRTSEALSNDRWVEAILVDKTPLTEPPSNKNANTSANAPPYIPTLLYRIAFPKDTKLTMNVGEHISFKAVCDDGKTVIRQYTPITTQFNNNYLDFGIKLYPNGAMSKHLQHLTVGSKIQVKGPSGKLQYRYNSVFSMRQYNSAKKMYTTNRVRVKDLILIAGGSGISPILQVLRALYEESNTDITRYVFYGASSESELAFKDEIDTMKDAAPSSVRVHYAVVSPPSKAVHPYIVGFITREILHKHLPSPSDDTLVLICGPPPMVSGMLSHLHSLNYNDSMIFVY